MNAVVEGAIITPAGVVQLTPEEAQVLAEVAEQKRQEELAQKRALAQKLSIRRDECVRAKRTVEQRWIESRRQYRGLGRNLNQSKQYIGDANDVTLQPPRIHATRKFTDRWEARLSDMLFPTKEQVWDLAPSPEAALPDDARAAAYTRLMQRKQQEATPEQPPAPPTEDELRSAIQEEAELRAQRMATKVKDQLDRCKFVRSGRRMVRDGCQIGAGLLMGPMNGIDRRRTYSGGMQVTIVETPTPEIREGDPWCFFPDMTPTADKAEYAFYLHLLTAREVQELAKNPGFDADQVRALLKTEPDIGEVGVNIGMRNEHLNEVEPLKGRYAVWRYTGCLDREEMAVLGHCSCDDVDPLEPIPMVDLWYSQDCVLKSKPMPLEGDYRIPYYVFSPFPADGTMFGYSLADMCSNSQRVCDSSLAMALHNMSVSSGPFVAMKAGKFTPADKRADVRGPKLFWYTGDEDIRASYVFDIMPNVAEQCWAAFDRALSLIEFEINSDQLSQDDQTEAVTTSSGLAMLLNTKSIIQRHAAACADDEVITPIIERMVWWNMQFTPDESIKGDYDTIPKAQTVQLVKDVQAQQTLLLNGIVNSDPDYKSMVDKYEFFQSMLAFFDISGKDRFIVPREEWERNRKSAPPDPGMRIAEAQAAKAEAEAQKAAASLQQPPQADGRMAETQVKASIEQQKIDLEREKIAAELQIARDRLNAEVMETAVRLRLDEGKTMALLRQSDLDRQMKGAIELAKNESYNREMDIKQTSPDRQGV